MKKHKIKWLKFPSNKPKYSGLFAIVVKKTSFGRDHWKSSERMVVPETNVVNWGIWSYKEMMLGITESHVSYKKLWGFFDQKGDPISEVTHFMELPPIPENITQGTSEPDEKPSEGC